jgi:hypothetical protein
MAKRTRRRLAAFAFEVGFAVAAFLSVPASDAGFALYLKMFEGVVLL